MGHQSARANTVEKRLLNPRGQPNFNVNFYIVNAKGNFAGVSLYESSDTDRVRFAICDEGGPRALPCEALFPGTPSK